MAVENISVSFPTHLKEDCRSYGPKFENNSACIYVRSADRKRLKKIDMNLQIFSIYVFNFEADPMRTY